MAESLHFAQTSEIDSSPESAKHESVIRPAATSDAVRQLMLRLRVLSSMDPQVVIQRLTVGDYSFFPKFEEETSDKPVKLKRWDDVGRADPSMASSGQFAEFAGGEESVKASIEAERNLAESSLSLHTNRNLELASDFLSIAAAAILGFTGVVSLHLIPLYLPISVSAICLTALAIGVRSFARRRTLTLAYRSGYGVFGLKAHKVTDYSLKATIYVAAKRLFDTVVGGFLLLISLPIIAVAAFFIRLESKGSPFVIQTRLGKFGQPFRMVKLRGMYVDARARFPDLYDYSKKADLAFSFRQEDDPRITKVGIFLRATSLDELPTLWNVISGNMSLVGPRPEIPEVIALYGSYRNIYLSVKPGIACLSNVTGRDRLTKREIIEFDIEYVTKRSFSLDLKILGRYILGFFANRDIY